MSQRTTKSNCIFKNNEKSVYVEYLDYVIWGEMPKVCVICVVLVQFGPLHCLINLLSEIDRTLGSLEMTVFLHKCSNWIRKELFKWSEIWHEHRPIYGTDYWLRKFGGP